MPEIPDTLQTISEIGAAFAGFAALVSALALRQGDQRVIEITRLHVAVAGSLIVTIGGLIPSVVDAHLPASEHLWRISAAVLFTINYGYPVVYASWLKRLRGDRPQESRSTQLVFYGLEALFLLSILACALGLGSGAAFYLTALIALLAQSATTFLGIVASIVENMAGNDAA